MDCGVEITRAGSFIRFPGGDRHGLAAHDPGKRGRWVVLPVVYTVFLLCAATSFLAALVLGVFAHRLKLTPSGLEYQRWPLKRTTATWTEVEAIRVGKRTGSATLLVRRTRPGFELDLGFMTLGAKTYKLILLSDFTGWREGNLLEEMRVHLPTLKVDPPCINDHVAVVDDRGQPSSR